VFKKGNPSLLDNYQGIAVGSVFGKLFSLIIIMIMLQGPLQTQ
jgi:hypothetical protein